MKADGFRAEHIGSLVRPDYLIDANVRKIEGKISDAEFAALQDRAVDEVVRMQEDIGLRCITDGEFRRMTYISAFLRDGFNVRTIPPRSTTPLQIMEPIEWQGPVHVRDFEYVKPRTKVTPKITLLGACRVHWGSGRNHISAEIYPDIELFFDDLVAAARSEIRALGEAGCTYVQIDDTTFAKFGDEGTRKQLADRGEDWRALIPKYIEVTNRVVADPPPGMEIALHMCRGNSVSHPADFKRAEGGYDVVAEKMFNELAIDRFFLEYDTPRAGDFSPLRFLPKHKSVVLGLVSTKQTGLESADELRRRIDEAAKVVDLERLAISPQCGFASGFRGHPCSIEQQNAKLRLLVDVARKVWGSA